jgi:extracellular factor (EF) 3-hydroxypalmitic acid methyl ester biosynthesis protein
MTTKTLEPNKVPTQRKLPKSAISTIQTSLRTRIKLYKKRSKEIEHYLSNHPNEWGKFQSEFNDEVNGFFREIMNYEKNQLSLGNQEKVQILKDFFVRNFRKNFYVGDTCRWSIDKPLGYPGDFKIIYDIYLNSPKTQGFERLFDNYFQMSAVAVAVRNRKEDFKRIILEHISKIDNTPVRIMNLASGSAKEVGELFLEGNISENVFLDFFDHDKRALDFSRNLLPKPTSVRFFKKNAYRIAAARDISKSIPDKYDLIYSAGLFDYLNHKTSVRLCENLKKILTPNGLLLVSNMRDKYSNPSVHFMEWAGDWNLIYRNEDEFTKIFTDAKFTKSNVKIEYEQQGVMQYAKSYKS